MEAVGIVGPHEAVWNSPPTGTPNNASVDGPLLGNGDMLVAMSGPPERLVFHLGKNDFWRLKHGSGNAMPLPVGTLSLQCADLTGASYQVKQSLAEAATRGRFSRSDGALEVETRVLAQENLLLIGLTAEERAFEVRCDLTAASGRGSNSAAGIENGVPWMERSFAAGTVDIPAKAACAMQAIGTIIPGSGGRPEATRFTSYNVNFGREQWSGGSRWGFDGSVDELALYKVALTEEEVAALHGGSVPQTGLVGHWSMDTLPAGSVNATTVAGRHGSATDYLGASNSYTGIGTMSVPEDVVSLACWINVGTTGVANYLFSCGEWNQGVSLGLSGGKVRFAIKGRYLETSVVPTGSWVHVAATENNGDMKLWLNGALAAQTTSGGSSGVTLSIGAGETAWLGVAMDSMFKSAAPREAAIARCDAFDAAEIPSLIEAHAGWWAGYWDQSWIEIGDPAIEKAYYLSYHGMGACSGDPSFPPALFGWTTTDNPSWAGDYHLNYNFQAPFYALASGNRLEQLTPHDAPILDFLPRARNYATTIFGPEAKGVIYSVGIGPLGIDVTLNSGYSYPNEEAGVLTFGQRSNAAYSLLNMAQRWRTTYDPAYGAEIYPFVKEVVAFWEDYLVHEGSRYKIVGDSVHEGSGSDVNPILTLGLLRNAFDLVLDLSKELELDADKRATWQDILEHLSGYTTQIRSGRQVFRYTESGTAWWNDNTLGIQHIYPGGALNMESDPALVSTSLNTLDVMQRWFDFNGSNSFFPAAARMGYEPRLILAKLREYAGRMRPNGFQQNNPHGIENLSTVPNTINEMLCMSHVALGYASPDGPHPPRAESIIRVFGAWPLERDARFVRLRAWGGFLVSSSLCAGEVQYVELLSEQGRHCTLRNPWPGQPARLYRNGTAAEVVTGDTFVFPTSAGESLRLFPGEHEMPTLGQTLRMTPPAARAGTPLGGTNLSFENGMSGWTVNGGTSTFAEDGISTTTPLPDGNFARGLRADSPSTPIRASQSLGPAAAGEHVISFHVADRIAERWLNYQVELLAGATVVLSRDSDSDPSLRPPNGSTSHPGSWGFGGSEGNWHQVRLSASIPPSLAGQALTLRFTSTTRSSGDNGLHDDFALDAIQVSRLDSGLWPLAQEIQSVQRQPDGSTLVTLNWLSAAGMTYRVESSTTLQTPWTTVQTGIAATQPVNSITVQFPSAANCAFLRVVGW
ncbi:LamG domain-containing protein [Luteolibacter arcticus]|uniref:LamG domain-containing protein n=1 Tax=Luteolibacter arcticus TaxID=1581411 RepID=A0ABT3GJZ4_9BACT|nr:LamG domain-containing protein [Luteolibacter arcticus]MCW1923847.1 LamG domain-containing protein [Luteolibacter arcticus]